MLTLTMALVPGVFPHVENQTAGAGYMLVVPGAVGRPGAYDDTEFERSVDTLIRALYVIGYNREGCFVTPEPLGPGGDPYPAMYGKPDK